jgi:pSer/pThr/pTyr-binding forkhead associated (FHA) protein
MAKLHFSLDGSSLGEFNLDKERITIGRRPANDIHIDNLAVSGDHAVVTTIGKDSFLEDLNSTNGTMVNGKPIKKHVLQHGDLIAFGKYQLKYANEAQGKVTADVRGFENTVVMRPGKLAVGAVEDKAKVVAPITQPSTQPSTVNTERSAAKSAAEVAVSSVQPQARLQLLTGTNVGQEVLLNKALTTLGKPGVQVAVITKRPHGYFIAHVEGEAMPLVNGQKISAQAHALNDHDVIDLIGTKMEFYLA